MRMSLPARNVRDPLGDGWSEYGEGHTVVRVPSDSILESEEYGGEE